jgi:hypothetical protein
MLDDAQIGKAQAAAMAIAMPLAEAQENFQATLSELLSAKQHEAHLAATPAQLHQGSQKLESELSRLKAQSAALAKDCQSLSLEGDATRQS